jgi:hypothetical protein
LAVSNAIKQIDANQEVHMNRTLQVSLAVTVAGLFSAGCGKSGEEAPPATPATETAAAAEDGVKCLGINECKGQGGCAVPDGHSCAGQNECKGKGWVKVSAADCTAKGGTVL